MGIATLALSRREVLEPDEDKELVMHPELLSVALLDEIAGRLMRLEEIEKKRDPQGFVDAIEPIAVTDQIQYVSPPRISPWFSVTVINDGGDDMWVLVNPSQNPTPHHVLSGETYNVDMRLGVIEMLQLYCDPGDTTTVRLVGVR